MPSTPNPNILTFKQWVDALPEQVYRAFTHRAALREWLCEAVEFEGRKGGRVYLWWNSGYYTAGEVNALVPGRKVAFTWLGRGEPAPSQVTISLRPAKGGTSVAVAHAAGRGKLWAAAIEQFERGWVVALQNLRSVIETGVDLRIASRPMLGIQFGEPLTTDDLARLAVPAKHGLQIKGVVDGMGAQAAGLQKDDVLLSLGGHTTADRAALSDVMNARRAGDKVRAVYCRGGGKHTTTIELSPRPMPRLPDSAAELADAVRAQYAEADAELEKCFAGVTQEEARCKPAPGEWSANEVLAHVIVTERELQSWLSSLIADRDGGGDFTTDEPVRVGAVAAVLDSSAALMEALRRHEAETVAMLAGLPDEFVTWRASFWRMAYELPGFISHRRGHHDQIRAAIQSARAAKGG